jgi:uncharacterized Zn finger protein
MKKKSVELILAFEFTCDTCGSTNYVSAVTASTEEMEMPEEEGYFVAQPNEVECYQCGEVYETERFDAEDY